MRNPNRRPVDRCLAYARRYTGPISEALLAGDPVLAWRLLREFEQALRWARIAAGRDARANEQLETLRGMADRMADRLADLEAEAVA